MNILSISDAPRINTFYGKERLEIPVCIIKNSTAPEVAKVTTLSELFRGIKDPNNSKLTKLSSQLLSARKKDLGSYDSLKKAKVSAFMLGKFDKRSSKLPKDYIPLLCFDMDGLRPDLISFVLNECEKNPYCFAAFPSISGHGLRIMMWCDSTAENHKQVYVSACEFLANHHKCKLAKDVKKGERKTVEHIDTSTSNINRIWFFGHVEEGAFYLNLDSQVYVPPFEPKQIQKRPSKLASSVIISDSKRLEVVHQQMKARAIAPFHSGRNNWIMTFSKLAKEHGLSLQATLSECLQYQESDFTAKEIESTVNKNWKAASLKFEDKQIAAYIRNGQNGKQPYVNGSKKQNKEQEAEQEEVITSVTGKESKFTSIKNTLEGKYNFRMNMIAAEVECSRKSKPNEWEVLNENDLICELLEAGYNGVETPLMALLKSSRYIPRYNPFYDYFERLSEWDGQTDYIKHLASYVKAVDQEWFNSQFKKMLVRSVACALNIIPFNKHCFTLKGDQDDGKTTYLRFLCPPQLQNYIKEDLDIDNKDGRIALSQNLFINFDELSQFSRKEINKIKSFFTIDHVKERLPYDRKPTRFPRTANFVGSTNNSEILADHTGNVRWLIFEITGIQHDHGGKNGYNQNIDIDLVWSQAYALLKQGFQFKLTKTEIEKSEQNNKSFTIQTLEEQLIQEKFVPAERGEEGAIFLVANDVREEIVTYTNKNKLNLTTIGKAMTKLGFKKVQKRVKVDTGNGEFTQPRYGYWTKKIVKVVI